MIDLSKVNIERKWAYFGELGNNCSGNYWVVTEKSGQIIAYNECKVLAIGKAKRKRPFLFDPNYEIKFEDQPSLLIHPP